MSYSADSPFLSLPAELRLYMYEYYFLSTAPKPCDAWNTLQERPYEHAMLHLFLTCRQIYTECRKVAYKTNTFVLRRISQFQREEIERLAQRPHHDLITTLMVPLYPCCDRASDKRTRGFDSYSRSSARNFVRCFPALHTIFVVVECEAEQPLATTPLGRMFQSLSAMYVWRRRNQPDKPRTEDFKSIGRFHCYQISSLFPRKKKHGDEVQVWRSATMVLCRVVRQPVEVFTSESSNEEQVEESLVVKLKVPSLGDVIRRRADQLC